MRSCDVWREQHVIVSDRDAGHGLEHTTGRVHDADVRREVDGRALADFLVVEAAVPNNGGADRVVGDLDNPIREGGDLVAPYSVGRHLEASYRVGRKVLDGTVRRSSGCRRARRW
jgi:hypothetical protein